MITQIQIINTILSSHDFSFIIKNNITYEFFPNFVNEFNFISNHYKQYGQVPDIATFLKVFPDFEIIEVTESVDYLLTELYKEKNNNFIISNYNKVRDLMMSGKDEQALNLITSISQKVSTGKKLDAINILEDISRYDTYLDKCNNFNKYYISTGFDELDSIIGGWDKQEELAVVAARSGVGKSWILLKFIKAAIEQGLRVGLFSGEMSVNKVAYRFDTLMSHISNGQIMHGNIGVANQYKNYLENLKNNHKGNLFVMTRDMVDGNCGVNALRSFVDKYELDILFVDQLSLLDDDHRAKVAFERAANVSKDLKVLQVQKHIPIISVSQQNRSAIEEGQQAGTENIAQSDRIAQDATFILFLTQKDNILTMSIGKSRDGGTGESLKYSIDIDKGRYDYIRDQDESESNDYARNSYESEGTEVF